MSQSASTSIVAIPQSDRTRAFAFMATMIAVWTIGLVGVHYSPFGNTLALRLAFAAASLHPDRRSVIRRTHSKPLPVQFGRSPLVYSSQ